MAPRRRQSAAVQQEAGIHSEAGARPASVSSGPIG